MPNSHADPVSNGNVPTQYNQMLLIVIIHTMHRLIAIYSNFLVSCPNQTWLILIIVNSDYRTDTIITKYIPIYQYIGRKNKGDFCGIS